MDVLLTWEVDPDLVIRTIELMGEFKQGVQNAVSKGFELQREFDIRVFEEGDGPGEQLLL